MIAVRDDNSVHTFLIVDDVHTVAIVYAFKITRYPYE
jgi:hypothetical protein